MKKLLMLFFGLAIAGLTFGEFSSQNQAIAASKTGKWIDVYGGGTTPTGAHCASSWQSKCMTGDRRSYAYE